MKKSVLVVCVHNTARSQMAEEYIRKYGGDRFEAESAGLEPGEMNPYAVKVLLEDGIDIRGKATRSVFDLYNRGRRYEHVITVCGREAEEKCPIFPGPTLRHSWPLPDPAGFEGTEEEILSRVREIRDAIKEKARDFVETEDMDGAEGPWKSR